MKRKEVKAKAKPRQAKPITKEILTKLIDYLNAGSQNLRVWRTVWRINLAFYGLLRWDDVCRLKVFPNMDFYFVFSETGFCDI